ncbi:MAG: hypothetical protein HOO06_03535 [Bdellovibrionaceae bacterium]|jgi:DNA repair exonuclease SbcCD ATPase subunit|nr:hypothetical protein [Pseudobdellovibrionaceae bacterium]
MLNKKKNTLVLALLPFMLVACQGTGFQVADKTVTELTQDTPLQDDKQINVIDAETQQALDAMEKAVSETEANVDVDQSILDKLNAEDSIRKIKKLLEGSVNKLSDSVLGAKDKVAKLKQELQDKVDNLSPNTPGYASTKAKVEALIEKLNLLEFKLQSVVDNVQEKLDKVSAKLDRLLERLADRLTRLDPTGITTYILEKWLIKKKDKIIDKLMDKLLRIKG